MTYRDAVQALVDAGEATGVPIPLHYPDGDTAFLRANLGDATMSAIAQSGFPGGAELPWAAEDLHIYRLDQIEAKQIGYRTDATTGAIIESWDQTRCVVADWVANPVSIAGDGEIAYSVHGMGRWDYIPIAADLGEFFAMLARWLRFLDARGGQLFDEDFEIGEAVREGVRRQVLAGLAAQHRAAAEAFVLGEI